MRLAWAAMFVVWIVGAACAFARQQDLARASATLNQSALRPGDEAVLAVVVDVQDGYHSQSHKPLDANLIPFAVTLDPGGAVEAGAPLYAEGQVEDYPALGRLSVYTQRVVTYVPIRVRPDANPGDVKLSGSVNLQICDDQMCFAPQELKFELPARLVSKDTKIELVEPQLFAEFAARRASRTTPATAPTTQGAAGTGVRTFGSPSGAAWSTPVAFGAAFLAGLLFNIMPCVLPVLPIKAKGFYEVAHHQRSRAFLFGLVFSLGLIAVFAVLAVLVLVLKAITWGDLFSNPYFVWTIVGLLVFLAMGMFGGYDVGLPNFIYNLQPRHDTVGGNFFWGALMAVLATPCTAPLLPPLLLWATAQPVSLGVPAIMMVGVGMAFPYLILSAFPELARGLPRSGPGAELFKQMLGFMMLAAAAYFAGGRLVHGTGFWWIVVAVVAVAAFYLMARTVQISKSAVPVAVSSILAVAMLGGILWWTARINGLLRPPTAAAGVVAAKWVPYSDAEFESARASGKPVLVKFTANWCATCQVIEGNVYQEPKVWQTLAEKDVVPFKVDLTDANAPGKSLLLKLNPAGGIPLTAIYPAHGDQPIVLASIYSTDTLLAALDEATRTRVAGK